MFEIKEISGVDATGKLFWGSALAAVGTVGTVWLVASIPAIIAC